ncbi:MAG TPA: hypothetical protein VFQ36_14040 [Ktedonobacteraceae bacterium]|nr:hypothetical protein [Ktedonobacteraceae bacterium]
MVKEQGDRKGRLYYDAAVKDRTFLVEATLAVALLSATAIILKPDITNQKRAVKISQPDTSTFLSYWQVLMLIPAYSSLILFVSQ